MWKGDLQLAVKIGLFDFGMLATLQDTIIY